MNKLSTLAIAVITMFTCSFSCNKNNNLGYMTATVNGSTWTANESLATQTTEGVTIQGTLHSSSGDYSNVALYLPRNYSTGTYVFDSNINTAYASYIAHNYDNNISLAHIGTVNVTSVKPNITGTFSFTCTDSTKIENGTFSIKAP